MSDTYDVSVGQEVKRGEVCVSAFSRLRSFSAGLISPPGLRRVSQTTSPAVQDRRYVPTTLILTTTSLYYESQGWCKEVLLVDLLGVELATPTDSPVACEVKVHHYPLSSSRKPTRKQDMMSFQFRSRPSRDENESLAKEWKQAIRLEAQRAIHREFIVADLPEGREESLIERHVLVIMNPAGGPGKALNVWQKKVQPLFDLAEISYSTLVTERQNHAREVIKDYDLSTIDTIVMASGDGLLYEVINGIMERPDWEVAIKTPLAMLPTGSGNAMCASSLHLAGEEYGLMNAAFQVISGGSVPMDVATIQLEGGYKAYTSVLVSWGLVSDIDIETEKFRALGEARLVLGTLSFIAKNRRYKGKISYLPLNSAQQDPAVVSEPLDGATGNGSQEDSNETGNGSQEDSNEAGNGSQEDPNEAGNGSQEDSNEAGNELQLDPTGNESQVDSATVASSNGASNAASVPTQSTNGAAQVTPTDPTQSQTVILSKSPYGPKTSLLPDLSQPVPSNWVTVDKRFVTVSTMTIPHLAAGMFGDPEHTIGSGLISVTMMDAATMGRSDMLYTLVTTDTGAYTRKDYCQKVFTRAYRLEPEDGGFVTVDGELVPYGPIQSEIHPGLARAVCRKRRPPH